MSFLVNRFNSDLNFKGCLSNYDGGDDDDDDDDVDDDDDGDGDDNNTANVDDHNDENSERNFKETFLVNFCFSSLFPETLVEARRL